MANDLTKVMPKVLTRALKQLRGQLVMVNSVRRDVDGQPVDPKNGATINIPKFELDGDAYDITPGHNPKEADDSTAETVPVHVNNHVGKDFDLSDSDLAKIDQNANFLPSQTTAAVSKIAKRVNSDLFSMYKNVGQYVEETDSGSIVTPFGSDTSSIRKAGRLLDQKDAGANRVGVVDAFTKENIFGLADFTRADRRPDGAQDFRDYQMGTALGFNWNWDNQAPYHAGGSITGDPSVTSGSKDAGSMEIPVGCDADDEIDLKAGDVISFGSHTMANGESYTYAVQEDVTLGNSESGTIKLDRGLEESIGGGNGISVASTSASYSNNLLFDPNAFVFVQRPIATPAGGLGNQIMQTTDPATGLTLRLEVERQYKQTRWEFDLLYGYAAVRPELAVRVAG